MRFFVFALLGFHCSISSADISVKLMGQITLSDQDHPLTSYNPHSRKFYQSNYDGIAVLDEHLNKLNQISLQIKDSKWLLLKPNLIVTNFITGCFESVSVKESGDYQLNPFICVPESPDSIFFDGQYLQVYDPYNQFRSVIDYKNPMQPQVILREAHTGWKLINNLGFGFQEIAQTSDYLYDTDDPDDSEWCMHLKFGNIKVGDVTDYANIKIHHDWKDITLPGALDCDTDFIGLIHSSVIFRKKIFNTDTYSYFILKDDQKKGSKLVAILNDWSPYTRITVLDHYLVISRRKSYYQKDSLITIYGFDKTNEFKELLNQKVDFKVTSIYPIGPNHFQLSDCDRTQYFYQINDLN